MSLRTFERRHRASSWDLVKINELRCVQYTNIFDYVSNYSVLLMVAGIIITSKYYDLRSFLPMLLIYYPVNGCLFKPLKSPERSTRKTWPESGYCFWRLASPPTAPQ